VEPDETLNARTKRQTIETLTQTLGVLGRRRAGRRRLAQEPVAESRTRILAEALLLVVVKGESGDGNVPTSTRERDSEPGLSSPDVRASERPRERLAGQREPEPPELPPCLSRDAGLIAFEQRRDERQEQVSWSEPAECTHRGAAWGRRPSIEKRHDAIDVGIGAGLAKAENRGSHWESAPVDGRGIDAERRGTRLRRAP